MKKIFTTLFILLSAISLMNEANALCLQCPEIQKEINKEIKLSKIQKTEIASLKKSMQIKLKENEKQIAKNQKIIDKILNDDTPDIIHMMEIKKENSKLRLDNKKLKEETYSQLFEVYTDEQKEIATRIFSENTTIKQKKKCDFCGDKPKMKK